MKTTLIKNIILGLAAMTFITTANAEDSNKENKTKDMQVKVLVVGLDNVSSNYFPAPMITEETGIPQDSIGDTYNRIITNNIIQANKDKKYTFVSSENLPDVNTLVTEVKVNGENEDTYADLSNVNKEEFSKILNEADADYVLFLNKHYLKWQDTPLRTLFHFVSYSLYDRNQHEVTKGNNYFTCMNLEKGAKLSKASRKSSSKIASEVIKSINKD
ncbi:uncharacterized protein BN759_00640 [Bacteroides sp. CAG:702]|nr:uncharacterized protein BN759_00640 [Bacteroides sp. CAG:702]